jgi:tripartite-type tricarboxylate transporter receptor subunit TctC
MPFVRAGKARAIAQASLVRHPDMPDLPTISDTVPGFEYPSWLGLLAPAATPLALRTRLATELNRLVKLPDVVQALGDDVQSVGSTPQEFERLYLQEHERWKKIVKETNVQFE